MSIIRDHRLVHFFVRALTVVLVTGLVKVPVESDSTQPVGGVVRLTRGSPQRLESADVVTHLGDDGAPVIEAIGSVIEVPAIVGTVSPSGDSAPAVVPERPAVLPLAVGVIDLPLVAYPALAPPGLPSQGRAPPSA